MSNIIYLIIIFGYVITAHSFKIHACEYSTAVRGKVFGKYKEGESGWSYGRKCHVSMDIDSCTVKEWIVTRV